GSVDNANRAALDLLAGGTGGAGGAAGAEVTAAPGERTLPDDIGAAVRQLADEVRRSGASHSRPLSTERMELSVSAAPLPAGADLDDGTVVVAATDLTERRRAERALVRAQRLEAMGQIAGRVAHDFNNLLTLIMGYSDLLRRSLDGDDTGLQMLTQIDRAAKRAAALTGQMLGFTRRRVGTTALVDLNEVLGNLERVLAGVAGANVTLTVARPPGPVWVRGDAGDLEQVVVNLAINAVDAMAGSGALTVSLQTAAEPPAGRLGLAPGAYAVLTVADEGPGMNEAVLARCTEPFFTTKEQGRGSGLGLSTVAGLAADFGGLLDIDSAPGRGTRAVIWLPLQEARAEAPAGGSAAGPVAGEPVRVRVLLVEDEDDLRVLATRALTEAGADVWAESTAEAVLDQRDRWSDFDVLVTDVIMPGLNGVELASRLRTARPDLPVLYVTGYANQALRQQGLVADARILRKPYTPGELRAALLAVAEAAPRGQGSNR
ncbi:MAG TPA: ATP-binding protein, partial [Acidimicrobiales bacterium]|nr:ATP-binding protein [Acidimicrobiales bacterium]